MSHYKNSLSIVMSTIKTRRSHVPPFFNKVLNAIKGKHSIDGAVYKRTDEYLFSHDALTGLHNRSFFEKEIARLHNNCHHPLVLIICDIDGLKHVNHTLGHDAGDRILIALAKILRLSFEPSDTVARIGSDEFAILLPGSTLSTGEENIKKIRDEISLYNTQHPDLYLSISFGIGVSTDSSVSMHQLITKTDNNMIREKLHSSQSSRSAIVNVLMKIVEARNFVTEGHSIRMQNMVSSLGAVIEFNEADLNDLRLFAQLHDIGKVGVPDRILSKAGPLTPDEYLEMQRHCEIGYRIALSTPDLTPIADWILKHHEWWNGQGYPQGIKEEEIPIQARILAIVDAYDAMVNNRPYRQAMSHREAVAELWRCSGAQFDPELVEIFVAWIEGHSA